jgi:hypothetical protein
MLNQRKLETLANALTAKERAVLWMRACCAGDEPDHRLRTYCPPEDRAEFERYVSSVEHGSGEIHGQLIILLEWLANTESEMHWLRIYDLLAGQVREMEKVTGKRAPKLQPPWNTNRQVPIAWGTLLHPDRPVPRSWDDHREMSKRELRTSLELRWRDLAVIDEVLSELERVFGEPLLHHDVAERLDWFRESLQRLSSEYGGPIERGAPDLERVQVLREAFGLDELGEDDDPRARMHETNRASLEAFEREQAKMLRNGS